VSYEENDANADRNALSTASSTVEIGALLGAFILPTVPVGFVAFPSKFLAFCASIRALSSSDCNAAR
jgi:hypothetical protein